MAEFGIYVEGKGGNIGQDLLALAAEQDIEVCSDKEEADFVALCLPSYVAEERLQDGRHNDKVVIDFSGVAKRKRLGQYGLMLNDEEPWSSDFDPNARVFGNPGCIAGATLRGLHKSRLIDGDQPKKLAIFATGGNSYASSIESDDVRLARRLIQHPHVNEITVGLRGLSRVTSFMPVVVGGFERGLMVGISGSTTQGAPDMGNQDLHIQDVVGTSDLQHRLEIQANIKDVYEHNGCDFSLGVVVDNLRFVTQNAVDLMHFVAKNS